MPATLQAPTLAEAVATINDAVASGKVPDITEAHLKVFHHRHFPDSFTPTLSFSGDDGGLGYYTDGVKRTLTDEDVAWYRQHEITSLLRERRQNEQSSPDAPPNVSPTTSPKPLPNRTPSEEPLEEAPAGPYGNPTIDLQEVAYRQDNDNSDQDNEDQLSNPAKTRSMSKRKRKALKRRAEKEARQPPPKIQKIVTENRIARELDEVKAGPTLELDY
ncbi:hypothetical protein K402DRAFT_416548 [Aulographum hederae CBS 113979]|uniref:Uncharacterized protein n=1 Tax=Aulographum hederae CBS 113979 TaxID=1176131 RepID=A0A6G1HGK4_9PEZI|nr:hypothetical protein K402DRAFT_416548 [Aulographum hederae CBS 113979]